MSDSTKDRIEGATDNLKGKAKEAVGNATDDQKMQGQGQVDQGKGKIKEGIADARDKVDDKVKNLTNG